jgi:polysaccharide biosynthesis transport protein
MSKNFELMQQAEIKLDPPTKTVPIANPPVSNGEHNGHAKGIHLDLDRVAREESMKLVQNVFLLKGKEAPRVVVFAGIDSGSGCSKICAHAAEVLATQNVGAVCLVDANLRSPRLPELFGVNNHYGLTDALQKSESIREFAKPVRLENLWLLSSGSLAADSPSLLNSDVMKSRMSELRKEFDYVLIDSPPLNPYADGIAMGQLADGLLLVLEANSTRREVALRVSEHLRAAQVRVLGAVLNKCSFPIPEALYNLL